MQDRRRPLIATPDKNTACARCGKIPATALCDGCQIPLCKDCRKIDLWGYGCGHVDTKIFCETCFDDMEVNPYGGRIEKEAGESRNNSPLC